MNSRETASDTSSDQTSALAQPLLTLAGFIHAPVLNYALHTAHVPLVRQLTLRNDSTQDLRDLLLSIALLPDIAAAWSQRIDSLPAGASLELDAIHMPLRSAALAELTERMEGQLRVSVHQAGVSILEELSDLTILPYDHWQGISVLPESIAAFITPNHPQIPAILRRAADILAGWTGNPSFDEYQSRNPDRVRKQMAAIYEALTEQGIVYCTVPASFEEQGQRIRLADALLDQKLGNCLDMSLLYAACLEAAGIHPLLVIVHGHAFAGAWLVDESFADAVSDDPSLLSKRTAAGISEIALVECTGMNAGISTRFDDAVQAAENRLAAIDTFVLFVDVRRARFARIRPLPLRIAAAGGFRIADDARELRQHVDAPATLETPVAEPAGTPQPVARQQLWERKLLDLTLRNNLLNLRATKGTVQFLHVDPARLEDALANDAELQILPRPADWEHPLRHAGLFQALQESAPLRELAAHELSHHRLRSYLNDTELGSSLTALYRSSRTSMEENGANTLYIALGFLKWFETPASEMPRYAPLLLIPAEILRKTARQGYIIRSRDEEPVINITLLEKLRHDFGITVSGLDTLPRDENGIDVAQVFRILRKAVMAQSRWEVEEQVVLGSFSFAKFILWNDIHNNADKLLENTTVASLSSGKLEWVVPAEEPRAADESFAPAAIALPIATDSSQLEAVIASGEGRSFVLHGPPGTGKSQTITNIIANALFAGKRVLFVAAKKAALDVVEHRLESIGIGPFCLELHSNKAKKSAVMEQLRRASTVTRRQSPERFLKESERLAALRAELNDHVRALHGTWPFGLSLYEAFSRWSSEAADVPDSIPIPHSAFAALTIDKLHDWNDIVRELAAVGRAIGQPAAHPLAGTAPRAYSSALRSEAGEALQAYQNALQAFRDASTELAQLLRIKDALRAPSRSRVLAGLASAILGLPQIPAPMLRADSPEQTAAAIKAWTATGRDRDAAKAAILESFEESVLALDAAQLLDSWNAAGAKWFLPKWLGQNRIFKTLKPHAGNQSLAKSDVPQRLHALVRYKALEQQLAFDSESQRLAAELYSGEHTGWDAIDEAADAVVSLNKAAVPLTGPAGLRSWRQQLEDIFGAHVPDFIDSHRNSLEAFISLHSELQQLGTRVAALMNPAQQNQEVRGGSWIGQELDTATRWLSGLDKLKDWCAWTGLTQRAAALDIDAAAQALNKDGITPANFEAAYRKSLYRSAADYILAQRPELAAFNSALFEEKIARFRTLSEQFEQLTRQELYARIAARVPDFSQEAAQSSEVGILQKAIRSNGRGLSIRRLFDLIPALLPRIAPCALMSPISVAQYFDAGGPKFDLVIFDEASQLPTCEAVGAIARGNAVIVVGDPKQMPPTSFFAAANIDEDNLEKEDLESILDDCLALSMPSRYLLWHYRSRHESLIAFSNAKYYDNSLLTFPSTDDLATKVTAVHVPGFYDKGATRQNKAEAQAIVAEILRRLSDPALPKRSLGVVTFSSVQQNLIEDLLTEEFRKAPQLEKLALEGPEPIFIKNLENVQGDERDVILFSVCYGPDERGTVSLNFGPLNREGGWRRLNVAVSRARYEMKVFATLKSDQIDLARSGSEGVAGLKAFLAFAEKGKIALPAAAQPGRAAAPGLEARIAEALQSKGFTVHREVGCSGYKIDLAIVHPDRPHEYLLGVLCDGPAYGAAKTARDRELVQISVLQSLGWRLHRVWAVDWWESPEQVLEQIVAAIAAAQADAKHDTVPANANAELVETSPEPAEATTEAPASDPLLQAFGAAIPYRVCGLKPVQGASAELLLQPQSEATIRQQISDVLEAEAPISKDLMYRRVLDAWGTGRAGTRITAHLDRMLDALYIRQSGLEGHVFLWKETQHPNTYEQYRVPEAEADKRDAEDLPPDEIAVAVRDLLRRQLSLPRSSLVKECARLFGYARLGTKVEEAMQAGVDAALRRGFVTAAGDRIVYNDKDR